MKQEHAVGKLKDVSQVRISKSAPLLSKFYKGQRKPTKNKQRYGFSISI